MANENKNTGPNTAGGGQEAKKSIIDAKEALRELLDDQGDYNNLLKTSLRDLDNMQKSYTRIAAKIDSLNKGSINVKQVNQELARIAQKEYIAKQKVLDLQAGVSRETKADLQLQKSLSEQLKGQVSKKEKYALIEKQKAVDARLAGNIELKNIELAKVAAQIAEQETNTGKAALETEKQVSKQMGISGNLMQKFAEKLGVGEEAYAAMSFEARKLVDANGKVGGFGSKLKVMQAGLKAGASAIKESFSDPVAKAALVVGAYKMVSAGLDKVGGAAASAGNFMAGMSEDSGTVVRDLASNVSGLARNIPLVGGLIGGLVDGFAALLDLVLGVDNMIVKTGRQLNLSAEGARKLYRGLGDASRASGDIYTNGKKYLESQLELTKQLGTTNILNTEILRTNIKLKEFAGLEEETRARIAESATITGKTAESTVESVLGQVVGLQKATGVSFQYQQVLKEVSSLGGYLGLQFAKYPKELSKSFLVTKTLGLELKKLDGMASGFLDFESSIAKEFEAQLLTGKEINLTKAREAFLNNDLAGAAAEISKYTGDAAGYSKMNRIQQDSLAEALGMSRDEMGDMLKQQEMYSKFQVGSREELLKQVDLLTKSGQKQDAIAKAGGEAAYNDLVRASAQEKLALFIEKIKQSVVEFVEKTNIIEKIEKFVDMLSNPNTIKGIVGTIKNVIASFIEIAGNLIADVVEGVGWIKNFFTSGKAGDLAEAQAMQTAAGIRKGAAGMVSSLRSEGTEYKTESVGGNVAASQTSNATAAAAAANMSMAPKTIVVQNNVTAKIQDNAVMNEKRNKTAPQNDGQTGILGN